MKTILFLLIFSISSFSQVFTNYYPQDFYDFKMHKNLDKVDRDFAIDYLKDILRLPHILTQDLDILTDRCLSRDCYTQRVLNYSKEVRPLIMGALTGIEVEKDKFLVETAYCHQVFEVEFRNGRYILPNHRDFNVEHTMPQSRFNRRISKDMQKSDLHNLFPVNSQINSMRSSFPFMEVPGHKQPISGCKSSEFGFFNGVQFFEPPQIHKGNVARAMAYFSLKYEITLSNEERADFLFWNEVDPVDEEEFRRNDRIYDFQSSRNPFVDFPHLMNLLK